MGETVKNKMQIQSLFMRKVVAVCGSDEDDENLSGYALETAEKVGRLIAQNGGVLVCGGRGGIMKAACKGCKEENGTTIGNCQIQRKKQMNL